MNSWRWGLGTAPKVVIVVVVVLVVLLGIGAALSPPSARSTTSSQSATSSAQTTPSQVTSQSSSAASSSSAQSSTSSVATSTSGPLKITVSQAISDQPEAQAGNSLYIYDVNFVDNGQSSYLVDEVAFTMISTSNSVYDMTIALAIQQSLPSVTLNPGQKASGQVAFQFPTSESPAKLEYHVPNSVDEFVTNLPTPSNAVSEPSFSVTTNVQGPNDSYGFPELHGFSTIQNQTLYYYTGQVIAIQVALSDSDVGTTVSVTSITCTTAGLSISQTSPALPVTVAGSNNANEVDVIVYIPAPSMSFSGTIALNISGS